MIHEATRTLVKSQPEVWEQCSDPESLSRHLNGSFGEIRITRLEPENTVAWEGEQSSGTVTIEASAWGTRVTLTARTEQEQAAEEVAPQPAAEVSHPGSAPQLEVASPGAEREPVPLHERESLMWVIMRRWRRRTEIGHVSALAAPRPAPPSSGAREAQSPPPDDGSAILLAALESMGQAHHRPYSRG